MASGSADRGSESERVYHFLGDSVITEVIRHRVQLRTLEIMSKSQVADRKPIKTDLDAGEHYWCACGKSNNQPFCDGSHAGTGMTPVAFTVEEKTESWLCLCKQTGNAPFCDGTHKSLPPDVNELEYPPKPRTGMPAPAKTAEEPTVELIHALAANGLKKFGHHGEMAAMGVPRTDLPSWDDIQILTAQLHRRPLLEDTSVGTELVIGPNAQKPLRLEIPIFVSGMSFGALSEEAKTAMARGAELAGTAICSGEGGMLPEEQQANSLLDGRGGATGAAPLLFRNNISVPTIPALARARRHLQNCGREDVTLIITGGIRTPSDFMKALCLGADGVAVANSAMQAIGCIAARICNTNNCPAGVATQKEELRARLQVNVAAERLARFLKASVELMQIMARACGHTHLREFNANDITSWKKPIADLAGIQYGGMSTE